MLELVQAVLLGGRPVISASRQLGGGKANYWRTAFRLALDKVAALVGLATKPRRPPVPEQHALEAAVTVAMVRKSAP